MLGLGAFGSVYRRRCGDGRCIAPAHAEKLGVRFGGGGASNPAPVSGRPKPTVTDHAVLRSAAPDAAREAADVLRGVSFHEWKFSATWDSRDELVMTVQRPDLSGAAESAISVHTMVSRGGSLTKEDVLRQVVPIIKELRAADVTFELCGEGVCQPGVTSAVGA